jgi:2-desacetyl-2-hydroxyethyl bacteriochlorophyllide A dehydrogenase
MGSSLASPSPDRVASVPEEGAKRAPVASAVWFAAPRQVEIRTEAVPSPRAGEIGISALCSAISHGTEMLVYRGEVDPGLALDLPTLQGSFGFPIKYGYASVGRVESVGPGVMQPRIGDLVFVHHPHQSSYVVGASAAIPIPPTIDVESATLLANLETAINIVLDARVRSGDRVVIFGQGVVGLLVTELVRRSGAGTIVAIDPVERRRALAATVGANAALPPDHSLAERLKDLTSDAGADLAIEVSGNPAALNLAINVVRLQGKVVAASWYGTKPVSLDLGGAFHRNRVRIVSSQVSHIDPELGPAWTRERRTRMAVELLSEITWQPLVTHRFPLERAPEAYRLLDEHPESVVQVLFTYV